ncbi:hypothetical protein Hanom_Chr16g01433631 [Helianthus anomalus]
MQVFWKQNRHQNRQLLQTVTTNNKNESCHLSVVLGDLFGLGNDLIDTTDHVE